MKRVIVGVVVGSGILFASGAVAQDYIFTRWNAHVTLELPPDPCAPNAVTHMTFGYYDTSAWMFYHCADGKGYARRFIHPNDSQIYTRTVPVMIVQPSGDAPHTGHDVVYDTTDKNWEGTGMTEAEWRRRYPVPGPIR